MRTHETRLIYYAGMTSRSKASIADLNVLADWRSYLVHDDYRGWHQFDPHLAGVQHAVPTSSTTARAWQSCTRD